MTLCDNGLLTYHPSLHVSPWGPGPGQSRRGGRAGGRTPARRDAVQVDSPFRKGPAVAAGEQHRPQDTRRGQVLACKALSCG